MENIQAIYASHGLTEAWVAEQVARHLETREAFDSTSYEELDIKMANGYTAHILIDYRTTDRGTWMAGEVSYAIAELEDSLDECAELDYDLVMALPSSLDCTDHRYFAYCDPAFASWADSYRQ